MKRKWQSEWDEAINDKLLKIHPRLGLWLGDFRIIGHEESILARIRIGHTYLTHSYFLKKEDPPQCIAFIKYRNRHFNVNSFKELFKKGVLII